MLGAFVYPVLKVETSIEVTEAEVFDEARMRELVPYLIDHPALDRKVEPMLCNRSILTASKALKVKYMASRPCSPSRVVHQASQWDNLRCNQDIVANLENQHDS